jgi:eukaryotic-like serine/threonine-protein kinase
MVTQERSYSDLFIRMTVAGLLLGALFGAIYGTFMFPIIGTLFGVFYGAVVGFGLGIGNGLVLILITLVYARFYRLRHYTQVCTLLTTLFSLLVGILGFSMILGWRYLAVSEFTHIPALIAALITGWVTQGLTLNIEKRKGKPKEKFGYDTRPNEQYKESVAALAQALKGHGYDH